MEGPTPVSALLHAATMVTAGLILVLRFMPLFLIFPITLVVITCVGLLTVLFAGLMGTAQYDIKRVVAYSTCSQIGLMFTAVGLSFFSFLSVNISFTHLFTHAFFKALLFLGSGVFIHFAQGEQDLRRGLIKYKFFRRVLFLLSIGITALMGLPFTSGNISKEMIVSLFVNFFYYFFNFIVSVLNVIYLFLGNQVNFFLYLFYFFLSGLTLTGVYVFRFVIKTFFINGILKKFYFKYFYVFFSGF